MRSYRYLVTRLFLCFWIVSAGYAFTRADVGEAPDPMESLRIVEEIAACKAARNAFYSPDLNAPRYYDVQHYTIHLIPDFDTESMAGSVEMQALSMIDGLQEITMDMGSGIAVTGITGNGVTLEYTHETGLLTIALDQPYDTGEPFEVTISYAGTPLRWTFTFSHHDSIPVFATMSEPDGAREWWPCNDVPWDKATTTLLATVPDWMVVASNGLLTSELDHGDGTHTVTWTNTYPIATYLVSAAGTNYETIMFVYGPGG